MRLSLGSWVILPLVGGCTASNPAFDTGSMQTAAGGSSRGSLGPGTDAGPSAGSVTMTDSAGGGTGGGTATAGATSGATTSDGAVEFTDDALEGEFSEGIWSMLAWGAGYLELASEAESGVTLSRIFDAGENTDWSTVEWTPRAPYGKPLPNDGASESGYVVGNVDMTGIELLLHLNQIESVGGVERVRDGSGNGRDGVILGSAVRLSSEGPRMFGDFIRVNNPFSRVEFPGGTLAPGSEDFTWALWFRGTQCMNSNYMLLLDSPTNASGTTSIWLGCGPCGEEDAPGVQFGIQNDGFGPTGCYSEPVSDDRWHHIAMVKEAHPAVEASFYFDGFFAGFVQAMDVGSLEAGGDEVFSLGGGSEASHAGVGDYDEVAIWSRALTANEVQALYRRGVQRLRIRVRSCDSADCAGESFVGPTGDNVPAFRDPPGALQPGQRTTLPPLEGRYIQYQAEFDLRSFTVPSPGLSAITLRGTRPR